MFQRFSGICLSTPGEENRPARITRRQLTLGSVAQNPARNCLKRVSSPPSSPLPGGIWATGPVVQTVPL